MRAIPSTIWKLTSLMTLMAVLGTWAIRASAGDEPKPAKEPAPAAPPKSTDDKPADKPTDKPEPKRIAVEFRNTPWQNVIEWFVKESGLAFISIHAPTGSFTFVSPEPGRKYTMLEIIDILNEGLQQQSYTILRQN